MKRIKLPVSAKKPPADLAWDKLGLSKDWLDFIGKFTRHAKPTHIQKVCLSDLKMLQGRRNLIVSAPTNSGKSLIGYLFLVAGLRHGQRVLLLEPFRALAQEKYEELLDRSQAISDVLGRKFVPIITTGDHPLDEDAMTSPPPKEGELVIATPERFDVILRNKDYEEWIGSFGAVCVDEAHLISDARRGGTLELVLATLLSRRKPPRILLLSATIGNTDRARQWLDPCDLAESEVRWPPLQKEIVSVEDKTAADSFVVDYTKGVLREDDSALIVFTYQKASALKLARVLTEETGHEALAYHSNMALQRKQEVRAAYTSGQSRVLVTTTALGTGVNLPATHLVIRDTTFHPDGRISAAQILQMLGRAGRGERKGNAVVVLRPNDDWEAVDLKTALVDDPLPEMTSGLLGTNHRTLQSEPSLEAATRVVLSMLCRYGKEGVSEDDLQKFGASMLAGPEMESVLHAALTWLQRHLLAHRREEDGMIVATTLGAAGAAGGLPPAVSSSIGALFRDLFSVGDGPSLVAQISPLDVLLLAELLGDRAFVSPTYSKELPPKVDDWTLASREKSFLFQSWIRGSEKASKANEILGSLNISRAGKSDEQLRRFAYKKMFSAIVLWSRGQGVRWEDIARRWGLDADQVAEEEWIRNRSWLIAGMAEIFDVRCFYFHLREDCQASDEQIKDAKRSLQRARACCFQLLGRLKYCSPLGPLLARMKMSGAKGVGAATIAKLENAGLTSPEAIRMISEKQVKELKLDKKRINTLQAYLRRA